MKMCVVCMERPRDGLLMCGPCGRSWDRDAAKDETMYAAIIWAARRARSAEKARGNKIYQRVADELSVARRVAHELGVALVRLRRLPSPEPDGSN